jgi:hypothetical protein
MLFTKIQLIQLIRSLVKLALSDAKAAVEFFIGSYGLREQDYKYKFSMDTLLAFTRFCALFTSERIEIRDGKIFPKEAHALVGADIIFMIDNSAHS